MSEPRSPADALLVEAVQDALASAADPERAPRMQAYMRSEMPFLGVPAPLVREVVAPLVEARPLPDAATWAGTVRLLWDEAAFREERYAALALARHRRHARHLSPATLPLLRHLVVTGAWWDLVDDVATHLVRTLVLEHPTSVVPRVRAWAVADDRWLRRAAVVCQVGTGERCDRELLVAAVTANLDGSTRTTPPRSPWGRDPFLRKAVGWALRDHARSDPEGVQELLDALGDGLSPLSRREAEKGLARAAEADAPGAQP